MSSIKGLEQEELSETFKKNYTEYYTAVFRRIAYITGNIQAAEDLAQETFIRLYNSPPSHSNTGGWLMKVAANLAYNYIRDEKTRKTHEPAADYEDSNVISIEDAAIKNSEVRAIKKILSKLAARDRLCLLLKFSGYKYNEIADIAGIDKNSVGKTLARAQEKFKTMYSKEVQ